MVFVLGVAVMPQKRFHMKKIKKLIRLLNESNLKNRELAAILNVSASTISYYSRAIAKAKIPWPIPDHLSTADLLKKLEPYCNQLNKSSNYKITPCWETIHKEMAHKHMTVSLIYEEYKEANPENYYSYSHFTREYKIWRKSNKISMSMSHEYGDKCFIDYAGDTIPIYDKTGKVINKAQVFISVLGGSKYTFATATLSQSLPDWISANIKSLEFFEGSPALLVPDNLKSAITNSCKYDPVVNPTYSDFAEHYDTTILPARSYKPKDKALAENAVLIVERWIMARLRKHKFYSLGAINNKIRELIIALNNKAFQKKSGSRFSLYKQFEKDKLKKLPKNKYEVAKFKEVKVQKDYHVCVNNHFYSVPYQLIGQKVEVRITCNTIEVLSDGKRVTTHIVSNIKGEKTTILEHLPKNHLEHKTWTIDNFLSWSKNIGAGTYNFSKEFANMAKHKEQSYRMHLGLKKLKKQYSEKRLESACLRCLAIGSISYRSLNSILSKRLDLNPTVEHVSTNSISRYEHSNIRGNDYFKQQIQEKK